MTDLAPASRDDQRWGLGQVVGGLGASVLLQVLVGGVILSVAGWTKDEQIPIWGLALLQIPLWSAYLGAVYLAGMKGRGVVRDFGLRMKWSDVPIGLAIGVFCQTVLLWLIYLPIFLIPGLDEKDLSRPAKELADRAGGTASWLLFALLVGILAPIVEELFYRGLLLRSLEKRGMAQWVSVVVTALVFAAIHMQPLQFPGLLAFGLVTGALAARSGRLGPSIWAHIGFNMTTVVLLYVSR
ncbi:hypothetical protein BH10ACT3_BH10ACT3_16810 [soil metagenome]